MEHDAKAYPNDALHASIDNVSRIWCIFPCQLRFCIVVLVA